MARTYAESTGETPLSENGGQPGSQFGSDSGSVANLKEHADGQFEALWLTLRKWESATDATEAKAVQNLRGALALLIAELEGIIGNDS